MAVSGGRVVVGQGGRAAARALLVRGLLAEAMTCHTQPRSRDNLRVQARPDDVCYNGERWFSIFDVDGKFYKEYQSHWEKQLYLSIATTYRSTTSSTVAFPSYMELSLSSRDKVMQQTAT